MTDTKEFDVIRIARSDGADTGPGYWPVTAPSASNNAKKSSSKEAAEKTPRAKPQMVRLAEDDPRFVEWRIKLGILLKQEVSPAPDEGNAWYVHFPKGYWLYEKSKHLWVSGYPVKAKLFKSPQEFGVHLLWLFSSSNEYADCCCVHCNAPNPSKALASEDPTAAAAASVPSADLAAKGVDRSTATKISPVPLPPLPGHAAGPQRPANIASRPQSSKFQPQQQQQQQPANPISMPQTPAASLPATPLATPQPQPHPSAQAQAQAQAQQAQQLKLQPSPQWSLKAPQTFRTGELVWFQTGNTWRLGIVASPSPGPGLGPGAGPYELVPLGHAMLPQPNVSKPEADLRPFHCFSVPNVDVPELENKTFDEVPWDAVFRAAGADPVRRDHINLDASKMAASKIDSSFSLWTRRPEDPHAKTVTYYGCFFGAERIEVGDCIRVKGGDLNVPHTVVMGLCHILIPTAGEYAGRLLLRGHIYYLSKGPPAAAAAAAGPGAIGIPSEDKLPVALREEIQWRKSVAPAQQWCAVLMRENIVLKEQSVRGRFYPTHRLLPLYDPVGYGNLVQSGQLRDQHVYLNNRMDAGGQYIGRRRNRLETLGASVPQAARLVVEQHVIEEA
ncbi:hypothetical protein ESCO_005164 [Escovopsis weberi]|uniref:Uncharacterized protein n=1 Tax=Escovopsis weberi TaxID=150374 RepID=A0A0M9VW06_ESCWE|nr:hypothetical protein ESCO_005164 [Escovopsis weberi]